MNTNEITISSNVQASPEDFWRGVKVYFEHPNAVNKQILCSETVVVGLLENGDINNTKVVSNLIDSLQNISLDEDTLYNNVAATLPQVVFVDNYDILAHGGVLLCVRKLTYKTTIFKDNQILELCFFDKEKNHAGFYSVVNEANFDLGKQVTFLKYGYFTLCMIDNEFILCHDKDLCERSICWLKEIFLPKFFKWMNTPRHNSGKHGPMKIDSQVSLTQYYQLYDSLKIKYGKYFVENWPEKTDAKKYVYEDVGIATYLTLLWKEKKQRFVDLGCGNGLLVHILNSEGHEGIGYDIRPRKIWGMYPASTVLKVETIVPTVDMFYENTDWLVGNHSDELTAWLPVLASNSRCNFFVLPCCPYRLNGATYQRTDSSTSVYRDFLNYVESVSRSCGFDTAVDRLRIPSTKRICFVGRRNAHSSSLDKVVADLITSECGGSAEAGFRPRESVEPVRNCTKLDRTLLDAILRDAMRILLDMTAASHQDGWNEGGAISVADLAAAMPKESLSQLKKECKGLQTLLRNHKYLFRIEAGLVRLRGPESMLAFSQHLLSSEAALRWKKKPCWFLSNHPQGCPLSNDLCSFSHNINS